MELLTTASEVLIFNLPLFSGKLLFKNAFIEDCTQGFLDFKLMVECDDRLCFLLPSLRKND